MAWLPTRACAILIRASLPALRGSPLPTGTSHASHRSNCYLYRHPRQPNLRSTGLNGQRQKIEGFELTDLPDVLQDELQFQLIRLKSQAQAVLAASAKDRPDPEVERHRQNEEAARQRAEAYATWYASLTKQERELEDTAKQARFDKAKRQQEDRAHNIWYVIAGDHRRGGKDFANRVISDPKRRPRIAKKFANSKLPDGVEELNLKRSPFDWSQLYIFSHARPQP
jgi:hypothetical protein